MSITNAEATISINEKLCLFAALCSAEVVWSVSPSSCASGILGVAIDTSIAIATLAKKKKDENFKKFISAY